MKPYYEDSAVTIYHGDCREILPDLSPDTVIVDPVWPNSSAGIEGQHRPYELFAEVCAAIPLPVRRIAVHLGCDSNPTILCSVPSHLKFFRVCWLELTRPNYVGRLMYGSDVAYLFGEPPRSKPGQHVIPGRYLDTSSTGKEADHPCPRKISHVKWLVRWWANDEDVICDPQCGSGTTLLAAKHSFHRAIGIEIEERYCEIAARRMEQEVLPLNGFHESPVEEMALAI